MRKIHDERAHRTAVFNEATESAAALHAAGHTVDLYTSKGDVRSTFGTGQSTARVRVIWPTEGTGQVTLRVMVESLVNGEWSGKHVQGARPLPGDRFGMLLVLGRGPLHVRSNEFKLTCRCDCGEVRHFFAIRLRSGQKRSCGCSATRDRIDRWRARGVRRSTYRGMGDHDAEYQAWDAMVRRCEDRDDNRFATYGARGISVCEPWRASFFQFLSDMGARPSPKHSLDRVDNDGNYEPANCRWATRIQQANNTTANRHVVVRGERMTVAECARRYSVPYKTLSNRLRKGWQDERAVFEPIREMRRHG